MLLADRINNQIFGHRRFVIRFVACLLLQVSFFCYANPPITLHCSRQPLTSVLQDISRQSKVNFVFKDQLIQDKCVTCQLTNTTVDQALAQVLTPHHIAHRWTTETIVVLFEEKQDKTTIQGRVYDAQGKVPLPFANIVLSGTNKGSATTQEGYFQIDNVQPRYCSLKISYIGYNTEELKVYASKNPEFLEILMTQEPIETESISITTDPIPPFEISTDQAAQLHFSPLRLAHVPSLGKGDFLWSVQMMPGVTIKTDNSADLSLFGSERIHNLSFLDGIPVCYKPEAYFGMLNPFHVRAIEKVTVLKGGYTAEYGDCVGGIVELKGNTVPDRRFNFGLGVDLFQTSGFIQVPVTQSLRFFFSINRSFKLSDNGPIYKDVHRVASENLTDLTEYIEEGVEESYFDNYHFSRLFHKVVWDYSKKGQLCLTGLWGNENEDIASTNNDNAETYRFSYNNKWNWRNRALALNVTHRWFASFQSQLRVVYTEDKRDTKTIMKNEDFEEFEWTQYDSIRNDYQLKQLIVSNSHQFQMHNFELKLGYEYCDRQLDQDEMVYAYYPFSPFSEIIPQGSSTAIPNPFYSRQAKQFSMLKNTLFLQSGWQIQPWCALKAGIRAVDYRYREKYQYAPDYHYPDYHPKLYFLPRASIHMDFSKRLSFNGSWGQYIQFFYIKNDVSHFSNMKNDLWFTANHKWSPCEAEHVVFELSYSMPEYQYTLEYYSKKLSSFNLFREDIPDYYKDLLIPYDVGWSDFLYGSGVTQGLEASVQKKHGFLTGWLSYHLGTAKYRFPTVYHDQPVFPQYHRNHQFKGVATFSKGNWQFSATAIYSSPIQFQADSSGYTNESESLTYDFSIPAYLRMDVGVSRHFSDFLSFNWELGIQCINVFNQQNVVYRCYYYRSSLDYSGVLERRMLPFLPLVYLNLTYR